MGHLVARFHDKEEHAQPATCMRGRWERQGASASLPPYGLDVVDVIQQGASRGYDECALTPAEAMVLAPHTFDIEASGDRSTRRQ